MKNTEIQLSCAEGENYRAALQLVHFEQVLRLMRKRGVVYDHLTAAPYAGELIRMSRQEEPGKLIDRLIISAFIEARSCERFAAVAPHLDDELATFYLGLLRSEARHFEIYIEQARAVDLAVGGPTTGEHSVSARIERIRQRENELIRAPAAEFRFHSGVPSESVSSA